jgi:IS4 transposase
MPTPAQTRRHGQARAAGRVLPEPPEGHTVRIVEYLVTVRGIDGRAWTETFRLVTTLLDHVPAPAQELAAIYAQRWEIENGYGELKTRLRGTGFVLRSTSPDLVAAWSSPRRSTRC